VESPGTRKKAGQDQLEIKKPEQLPVPTKNATLKRTCKKDRPEMLQKSSRIMLNKIKGARSNVAVRKVVHKSTTRFGSSRQGLVSARHPEWEGTSAPLIMPRQIMTTVTKETHHFMDLRSRRTPTSLNTSLRGMTPFREDATLHAVTILERRIDQVVDSRTRYRAGRHRRREEVVSSRRGK
jgi:hypothetical protein